MVQTKTYTFAYCHLKYLALFTLVPRVSSPGQPCLMSGLVSGTLFSSVCQVWRWDKAPHRIHTLFYNERRHASSQEQASETRFVHELSSWCTPALPARELLHSHAPVVLFYGLWPSGCPLVVQ